MQLYIQAFGKIRTPGLREAANYYLRNIQPWMKTIENELKPAPLTDKSPQSRKQVQDKEALLLNQVIEQSAKKKTDSRQRIYLLDETASPLSTDDWAALARSWEDESWNQVHLCIGSSMGFNQQMRDLSHGRISLGAQTLSHELARVVLYEQLYRAWSILRNHPYHHAGL